MRNDTCDQLGRIDRFGEEIRGTAAEQLSHLLAVDGRGLQQDRDVGKVGVGAQLAADVQPVQIRHLHVQQDQVRPEAPDLLQSRAAAIGEFQPGEFLLPQDAGDELATQRIVIRDQDLRAGDVVAQDSVLGGHFAPLRAQGHS